MNPFAIYDLVVGALAGAGVIYLIYLERYVVGHRRFFVAMTVGLLGIVVGGPLANLVVPLQIHLVHSVAALVIAGALVFPLRAQLGSDDWPEILLTDPSTARPREPWMHPMDERILELFHTTDIVLTPSLVAFNLDHSRSEVNRRLGELADHGYVERVDRGKYQMTMRGRLFLRGSLDSTGNNRLDWVPSLNRRH